MKLAEKWQKDLAVYQDINTTFIIEGNVHDLQPWIYEDDDSCEPIALSSFFQRYLENVGYDPIVFYNRIDGFSNPFCNEMLNNFYRVVNSDEKASKSIGVATELIRKALSNNTRPTAIVVDLANTIATSPDSLSDEELEYYTRIMLASKARTQALSIKEKKPLVNLLFLIVEKVNDIPTWVYLNNPYVRTLTITKPEKEVRSAVIGARFDALFGKEELDDIEKSKRQDEFIAFSEGMSLVELYGVFSIYKKMDYSAHQIKEAINMFRYGETESHWDKLDLKNVKEVEEYLSKRVKGQKQAISKVAKVLNRACQGMTGIQGGASSRPKGVLFFAGPTGTGKTELAKSIAEFVFGDECFLTRFDMSEYQQPHSDQKLLGAPPGYVGYSEGGQLTNAIKSKPFCVLLFDEIDKADPSILDKFLQILEDGRITDSAGETMYFSEALIIFTSNLCITGQDSQTGICYQTITPDMDYESIQKKLLSAITDYFKYKIQRPELLNRIGDNFVVFDYIREEFVKEILDQKLEMVCENIKREKGINVTFDDSFYEKLFEICTMDLTNGGRGISNIIESKVINSLAAIIGQERLGEGNTVVVSGIEPNIDDSLDYEIIKK